MASSEVDIYNSGRSSERFTSVTDYLFNNKMDKPFVNRSAEG